MGKGSEQRNFSLTVKQRGRILRGRPLCMIIITKTSQTNSLNIESELAFPCPLKWFRGKESTCNAGDAGSIPGSGRSAGEGIGYPLQYSWASPVAQMVKNSPAVRETWVQSLGWEDPLEKGKASHPSILAWGIPWTI